MAYTQQKHFKRKESIGHYSLFYRQCVWPRDGVSVEKGEKAPEGLKEGPVGQQTDTLVAMDTPGSIRLRVGAHQAQLRALSVGQSLFWVGLIELDGSTVHLRQKKSQYIYIFRHLADTFMQSALQQCNS